MYIESRLRRAPFAHHASVRISEAFSRAKTAFDEGESLWIPLMILGIGYGVVLPVFLLMLALDTAAARLWG